MRNIVNISLPEEMADMVKREVQKGHFATTSEFFRHLLRLWDNHQVAKEVEKSKKDFATGKYRTL